MGMGKIMEMAQWECEGMKHYIFEFPAQSKLTKYVSLVEKSDPI